MENRANLRLAMKVVLAKGQERGGVVPALFRLPQTIARLVQVCNYPVRVRISTAPLQ
jgi:hypothetical protein